MKIYQDNFAVSSNTRTQMIDITTQVQNAVKKSQIKEGIVTVFCPHTTAAITINENADPDVPHDILLTLDNLIPRLGSGYRHCEGNSDAHCKSSIVGSSEQIFISKSRLTLGTWQGIFFCEFDGARQRKVFVQIRGE